MWVGIFIQEKVLTRDELSMLLLLLIRERKSLPFFPSQKATGQYFYYLAMLLFCSSSHSVPKPQTSWPCCRTTDSVRKRITETLSGHFYLWRFFYFCHLENIELVSYKGTATSNLHHLKCSWWIKNYSLSADNDGEDSSSSFHKKKVQHAENERLYQI